MRDEKTKPIDAADLATVQGGAKYGDNVDPMFLYWTQNVPNGLATAWFKPWGSIFGHPLGF